MSAPRTLDSYHVARTEISFTPEQFDVFQSQINEELDKARTLETLADSAANLAGAFKKVQQGGYASYLILRLHDRMLGRVHTDQFIGLVEEVEEVSKGYNTPSNGVHFVHRLSGIGNFLPVECDVILPRQRTANVYLGAISMSSEAAVLFGESIETKSGEGRSFWQLGTVMDYTKPYQRTRAFYEHGCDDQSAYDLVEAVAETIAVQGDQPEVIA